MAGIPLDTIPALTGGTLVKGTGEVMVEHLLIDSRKLVFPSSSLFFALKGGHRDGHGFIPELYAQGVSAFVVSEAQDASLYPRASFILVQDTLAALQALAAAHRAQFHFPVIGITGSNGKTMTKEWLFQLLEEDRSVVRSPRSYNSQIGVPLSVWQMEEGQDIGIFEAGISRRGEMEKLERIIRPDTGIFTNIGDAHSEGFTTLEEKVMEKLRLFEHATTLIWCSDHDPLDAIIRHWASAHPGLRAFNWGQAAGATLQVIDRTTMAGGTRMTVKVEGKDLALDIPFTDQASVENTMHGFVCLLSMGMDAQDAARRMTRLRPLAMRLEVKEGIHHCTLINDSYNADQASVHMALDLLSQQQQHRKRTVILSDVMGSGKPADDLYRDLASALVRYRVDRLIGVGPELMAHREEFERQGISCQFFPGTEVLLEQAHTLVFREEAILIKGSRAFELERFVRYLETKRHQTLLEINLSALAHNLRTYRQQLPAGTRLMVMVKAFSYGAGSYEIASLLQFHQVDWLAVAYADEGVELRKAGIHLPIMVLNAEEGAFYDLVTHDLQPVIFSFDQARAFEAFLRAEGVQRFPVHIKVDTGMHRLGFDPGEAAALSAFLLQAPAFHLRSVFSHLAAGEDAAEDDFTWGQAERFLHFCSRLEQDLGHPFLRHMSNTAAIIRHPGLAFDMVRLGIGLYGVDPTRQGVPGLREVSTLRTTVAQVRRIPAGETVGYNRRSTVSRDSLIATIRIGYADGFPRSLGNGVGKVRIRGKLVPVIGSVCMDMTMVDVTDLPVVSPGDEVILFGKDLPIDQVAEWAGTIPYEIMTGISQRVQRVYFEEL